MTMFSVECSYSMAESDAMGSIEHRALNIARLDRKERGKRSRRGLTPSMCPRILVLTERDPAGKAG
jgi:hypothetical protein